jgi:CheY-like chemotaxis protein
MTKTILIVDDEKSILELLQMAVEMEGYKVITAVNGKEALEHLQSSVVPCLILLDLMMPIMNGWQFLDAVQADPVLSKHNIPIVMVTAFMVEESHPLLKEILHKPISMELLYQTLHKYCHCST